MPEFAYTARDNAGKKVTGRVSAATQAEVLAQLAQRTLFPVAVETAQPPAMSWRGGGRIGAQLMATTYGQLADLLRSGVPLLRSLDVLQKQTSNFKLADVLSQVRGRVEEGASLAEAMQRFPKVFSEMAINMVRAGGEGGFLEDALLRVAEVTERQQDLKSRTIGALAYPVFLSVAGVCIVTGLMIFIVPKFDVLFERLRARGELPIFTDWLLAFSAAIRKWGLLILFVVGIAAAYLRVKMKTEEGRIATDRLKLRLPMLGSVFRSMAVARFCQVLGTLLHNGVPIIKALNISADAAGNRLLGMAIQDAAENISSGESLAAPLAASGHFPRDIVEMIGVAEESNSLEGVLMKISEGLERRTWRQLELAVRLIEPIMLLILASVVLVVVIALLMPVIKMSTTI